MKEGTLLVKQLATWPAFQLSQVSFGQRIPYGCPARYIRPPVVAALGKPEPEFASCETLAPAAGVSHASIRLREVQVISLVVTHLTPCGHTA